MRFAVVRPLIGTREVAGATRRLPENLRFSLEAAGRRERSRAGPPAEAGEA